MLTKAFFTTTTIRLLMMKTILGYIEEVLKARIIEIINEPPDFPPGNLLKTHIFYPHVDKLELSLQTVKKRTGPDAILLGVAIVCPVKLSLYSSSLNEHVINSFKDVLCLPFRRWAILPWGSDDAPPPIEGCVKLLVVFGQEEERTP